MDLAIKMLTEMVAALRQENYKRQESIELLTARVEGFRVAAQYPSQLAPAALIDALVKAECALSDIAEGEGDAVPWWAENRCSDTLAIIRPVMQQHGIRTSEWPPASQPVSPAQQQRRKDRGLREKVDLIVRVEEQGQQQPDHSADASKMVDTGWQNMADGSPIMKPAPPEQQPQQSVPPAEIFPVEYADSDGDGIRILMEPADETGRVCWVVRNSRHVNPCHEFPSPEDAYAAHRRAQPAPAPPAPPKPNQEAQHEPILKGTRYESTAMPPAPPKPAEGLVERVAKAMGPSSQASMDAGDLPYGSARAAIREIAAWMRERLRLDSADLLEQEVKR